MKNPLESLRKLIAPSGPKSGKVISIGGAIVKVATVRGLVEYPIISGLVVGDSVLITADGQLAKPSAGGDTYWV